MKYLKCPEMTYDKAMAELLVQGGDTDTNAAIMGMVLGARDGLSKLDPLMIRKVEEYQPLLGGHKRPKFLLPGKNMLLKLDHFLANLPKQLIVSYDYKKKVITEQPEL
jgi:hypothetical protein